MNKFFTQLDFVKIAKLAQMANDDDAFNLAWNEYFKVMAVTLKKRTQIDKENIPILKPYIDDMDNYNWDEVIESFMQQCKPTTKAV